MFVCGGHLCSFLWVLNVGVVVVSVCKVVKVVIVCKIVKIVKVVSVCFEVE